MGITRRDFLKYCGLSAAALGLGGPELLRLEQVLANPLGPTVLWLQGSGCTGCSMSLLNRISTAAPTTAADLLISTVNLAYHPNLMAAAGQSAVAQAEAVYDQGNYFLAVEGGVPTLYEGRTCWAWTTAAGDVTFLDAVQKYAAKAKGVIAVGTCASWGGIPAAGPNPTGVKGVSEVIGKGTINLAGCPPHPDWTVWTVAQAITNQPIDLDGYNRPKSLFGNTVHSMCPRHDDPEHCLAPKGCRGPGAYANCPTLKWNHGVNWCINANAPCYACTEPNFPGTVSLYTVMYNHTGTTNLNCSSCHHGGYDD